MTDPIWLGQDKPPDPRWTDNPEPGPRTPREQRPPRHYGELKRVSLLGHLASVLVAVVAVASAFYAWTQWHTLGVINDLFARPFDFTEDQAIARGEAADNLARISVWLYGIFLVAAAVVFIVWLWRARHNAEALSDGLHIRARGWAIGGWFVPIVAWWFPYQVVRDVYRASDPTTQTVSGELRLARGGSLVGWWWACWIVAYVVGAVSVRHTRNEPSDTASVDEFVRWFRLGSVYDTVTTVFEILAAVLVILIIRRVSRWQESPAESTATPAAAQ